MDMPMSINKDHHELLDVNIHKAQACDLHANKSKSRKYFEVLKIMNLFEATKCCTLESQSLLIPIQKSLEPEATNLFQLLTARSIMPPCDHILAETYSVQ
jgi:hypothetical protein